MEYIADNIDSVIVIVYCVLIGIVIAFIFSLLTRTVYGKFIDALVRENASSEASAKALSELGIKNNFMLLFALEHKTTLSSLISCDNAKDNKENRRYYLKPENQIKAQGIYGRDKMTPISVGVAVLLIVVIAIFLHYAIPKIFN